MFQAGRQLKSEGLIETISCGYPEPTYRRRLRAPRAESRHSFMSRAIIVGTTDIGDLAVQRLPGRSWIKLSSIEQLSGFSAQNSAEGERSICGIGWRSPKSSKAVRVWAAGTKIGEGAKPSWHR